MLTPIRLTASRYQCPTCFKEMSRQAWRTHPCNKGRRKDANTQKVYAAYDDFLNTHGKKPTQQQLAVLTGIPRRTVGAYLKVRKQHEI